MHLISLCLSSFALVVAIGCFYFFVVKQEDEIESLEYSTKSANSYAVDLENLKNCINKADSTAKIKMCCEAVYFFRMRYRKFFNYGINLEADFDGLVSLIDERNHYLQTKN